MQLTLSKTQNSLGTLAILQFFHDISTQNLQTNKLSSKFMFQVYETLQGLHTRSIMIVCTLSASLETIEAVVSSYNLRVASCKLEALYLHTDYYNVWYKILHMFYKQTWVIVTVNTDHVTSCKLDRSKHVT